MKTTLTLAVLFSLASTVRCQIAALGGNYVDPAHQGPTVPTVWLVWDDNGVEKYSLPYKLSDECRTDLNGYQKIWVGPDPRAPQNQKGCGISYSEDGCKGDDNKFKLIMSELDHSKTPFGEVERNAKSFKFTDIQAPEAGHKVQFAYLVRNPRG